MSFLILQPVAVMMILTMIIWFYMYVVRNYYVIKQKINPQKISSPERLNTILPEHVNQPSNNLKNLFELPVVFYVLCVVIHVLGITDFWFIGLAWGFVFLRVLHSVVHCTFNHVVTRFFLYFISGLFLWAMVIRFCFVVFN